MEIRRSKKIVVRIVWVFTSTYLLRLMSASLRKSDPYPVWQNVAIVAWTGMRGVVSLAAALAVPLTLSDSSPFPGRDYILFITFTVILATLVFQGLSLPVLIRRLGVMDDGLANVEERTARLKANEAGWLTSRKSIASSRRRSWSDSALNTTTASGSWKYAPVSGETAPMGWSRPHINACSKRRSMWNGAQLFSCAMNMSSMMMFYAAFRAT